MSGGSPVYLDAGGAPPGTDAAGPGCRAATPARFGPAATAMSEAVPALQNRGLALPSPFR